MEDDSEVLIDIFREILGDEKKHYETHSQISFNCIECDEDRNKGNLEINYNEHVYHCWACNISGPLGKLIDKYGNKKQKKVYNIFRPETVKTIIKPKDKLKLPKEFTRFKDSNPIYPIRKQAHNYLLSRGITNQMIEKYDIGFCDGGEFNGRIIIPSYNKNGNVDYFIARSWDVKSKSKYKNPKAEKDKIIFNEKLIDWEKDIYLCEGVFDSIFLDNSIPMLGKHMSDLLFNTIYEKSKGDIIICLDGDAFKQSVELYNILNGGELYGRIKLLKLPQDKDVCDLKGNISEYYYEIR